MAAKRRATNAAPKKRRDWRPAFLKALAETANVTASAGRAGVDRMTAYRAYHADDAFAAAWRDAEERGCDALELEARRRAHDGLVRKKFTRAGDPLIDPATGEQYAEREYSDTLLIFLLKAHRPDKFRERSEQRVVGADGGALQVVVNVTEAAPRADPECGPATDPGAAGVPPR